jgi:predicted negative regulator of RcsB-dependent stress response
LIIAVILVFGYQYCNRRNKKNSELEDRYEKLTKKSYENFASQKAKDLGSLRKEVEQLGKQASSLSESLGGGGRKVHFSDEDETEISTKKYR